VVRGGRGEVIMGTRALLGSYGQGKVGTSFRRDLYKIANILEATTAAIIFIVDAKRTGNGLGTRYPSTSQFTDITFSNALAYTDVHL